MTNKIMKKVVLIGDPNVGKTSIRKKYLGKGFRKNYLPTMGADFSVQTIRRNNTILELQIWDLAGQETFEVLMPRFISKSDVALVVFDLTRKDSFQNISKWINKFIEYNKEKLNEISIFIIGNKNDLDNPQVTKEEIRNYTENLQRKLKKSENQINWIKTSALTGYNIHELFDNVAENLIKN